MAFRAKQYHHLAGDETHPQAFELQDVSYQGADSSLMSSSKYVPLTPEVSIATSKSSTSPWKRALRHFTGWRLGVTLSATLVGIILLINISFLIWAKTNYSVKDGLGTLREGDCHQLESLNIWIHVAINVLSTGMLSGSNFSMQRLSAPTRKEVDKAHSKNTWLDVGILSTRNLRNIGTFKVVVWTLLAFSSVPIHLLYNSAVFSQIGAYVYDVRIVTQDFVQGKPLSTLRTGSTRNTNFYYGQNLTPNETLGWERDFQKYFKEHNSSFTYMTTEECLQNVVTPFVTNIKSVWMITKLDRNSSVVWLDGGGGIGDRTEIPSYAWACADGDVEVTSCTLDTIKKISPYTLRRWPITGCLVEKVPERCELQFSTSIITAVIICNAIKLACMVITVVKIRSESLVTLGDAISSFLQVPDARTRGICLASKSSINSTIRHGRFGAPLTWRRKARHWFRAASPLRWSLTNAFCFIGILVPTIFLGQGLAAMKANQKLDNSLSGISRLGFGVANPQTIVKNGPTQLVPSIILANLPQLLLSMVYVTYNGIYTSEYVSAEWSEFSFKRKRLRVTIPSKGQNSTYWLSLPYICSVPLLIISALLHWLFSQSIFLIDIKFIGSNESSDYNAITTCGWSPLATIVSIICATLVTLAGISIGFRTLKPGIPLAGTCSAAIAAACHAKPEEVPDLAFGPIQWGVVSMNGGVGHCAFSSEEVGFPNEQTEYR